MVPAAADHPPQGDGWLHEPKLDGFRFMIVNTPRARPGCEMQMPGVTNPERWRICEGPRKPELAETQKMLLRSRKSSPGSGCDR